MQAPSILLQTISKRALRREVRDVEDAVPYKAKPKPGTIVGGGVLDAPLLALPNLSLRGGQSPTWQSVTIVPWPPCERGLSAKLTEGFRF